MISKSIAGVVSLTAALVISGCGTHQPSPIGMIATSAGGTAGELGAGGSMSSDGGASSETGQGGTSGSSGAPANGGTDNAGGSASSCSSHSATVTWATPIMATGSAGLDSITTGSDGSIYLLGDGPPKDATWLTSCPLAGPVTTGATFLFRFLPDGTCAWYRQLSSHNGDDGQVIVGLSNGVLVGSDDSLSAYSLDGSPSWTVPIAGFRQVFALTLTPGQIVFLGGADGSHAGVATIGTTDTNSMTGGALFARLDPTTGTVMGSPVLLPNGLPDDMGAVAHSDGSITVLGGSSAAIPAFSVPSPPGGQRQIFAGTVDASETVVTTDLVGTNGLKAMVPQLVEGADGTDFLVGGAIAPTSGGLGTLPTGSDPGFIGTGLHATGWSFQFYPASAFTGSVATPLGLVVSGQGDLQPNPVKGHVDPSMSNAFVGQVDPCGWQNRFSSPSVRTGVVAAIGNDVVVTALLQFSDPAHCTGTVDLGGKSISIPSCTTSIFLMRLSP